jgi:exonuclease III
LQETKLQESHLDDPKLKIRGHLLEEEGYDAYYTCSTAKKGYAGTAVFVRRRPGQTKSGGAAATPNRNQFEFSSPKRDSAQLLRLPLQARRVIRCGGVVPQEVSYAMGKDKHDAEGRLVIVDFPTFSFANLYVPNSGQKLERLAYRTDEWDKDLLTFMQTRQKERGVPVMWPSERRTLEVWNDGAKHLAKQAGITPGVTQAM